MSPSTWGKGLNQTWNRPQESPPGSKRGATGGSYGSPYAQPKQQKGGDKPGRSSNTWMGDNHNTNILTTMNIEDFDVEDW